VVGEQAQRRLADREASLTKGEYALAEAEDRVCAGGANISEFASARWRPVNGGWSWRRNRRVSPPGARRRRRIAMSGARAGQASGTSTATAHEERISPVLARVIWVIWGEKTRIMRCLAGRLTWVRCRF
jgi:hypothetical protein